MTNQVQANPNHRPPAKREILAPLLYHKIKLSVPKFWGRIGCRLFGHRVNDNARLHWCQRCGLAYEEIYHRQGDYYQLAEIGYLAGPLKGQHYKDRWGNIVEVEKIRDGYVFWVTIKFASAFHMEDDVLEGKTRLDVWAKKFTHA